MNKKALIIAAVAATLTSGAAFAQTYDNRDYRNDRYEQDDRGYRSDSSNYSNYSNYGNYGQRAQYSTDHRYNRDDRYNRYNRDNRDDRDDRYGRYDHHRRDAHRDYRYDNGSHYRVRRGEYLAHHYRGSHYVVSDWRQRRLYAPPRGYQWVQAGNDYALVALATGLIAHVLLNN